MVEPGRNMRDYLEKVVIKNLRGEILHFFSGEPSLTAERHRDKVRRLFSNLDDQATANLTAILERLITISDPCVRTYSDLFSPEEFARYERVKQFGQEIAQVDEYYQYKHYKLPVKRFGNETFLYRHGLDALRTIPHAGTRAVMDIGAYVGDSALIFAEQFPESPIYCFEPNAENIAHAQTTLCLNKLDSGRVRLFNTALGARADRGVMLGSTVTSYLSAPEADSDQLVEVDTLDNVVRRNALDVALIKVDVEGHEQQVLEGALETLRAQRPVLLMSIYHNYEQFFGLKPFIEELDLGYSFDFFWGISGQLNAEIMLLCEAR